METASPASTKETSGSPASDRETEICCPPLLGPSLSDEDAEQLAGVLKALADPIRLKLVNIISTAGESCACDLPELLDRSQPTVSHHLSILVKAGILTREQRGKWAWFTMNPDRLSAVCAALGRQNC